MARKAPFIKNPTPQGWAISQKTKNGTLAQVWWSVPGKKILSASGQNALGLLGQAQASGVWHKEIPAHWLALPTGLDLQVHLRHPGQEQKETLVGGLESALYGGYDALVSMPNTQPFLDQPALLQEAILSSHQPNYPVRIGFAASATRSMQGQEATDIGALARAGAVAITDDGWGVKSNDAQEQIFSACATHDVLFQQHAEMPGHGGVTPAGPFQKRENLPPYPQEAESQMIERDLALLRKHPKARYHVLHVSTKESVAAIRRGKDEGLRISAEVTPHHLFFSNLDIPSASDEKCTYFKMNPPLFGPEDREALRVGLQDGTLDCVSTDHAPHEKTAKAKGWLLAPFGTRGMETTIPVLFSLMKQGILSLEKIVEVFHANPRRILGFFPEATGLIFVDPLCTHTIQLEDLPGISENSCFLGTTLTGRIELRGSPDAIFTRS